MDAPFRRLSTIELGSYSVKILSGSANIKLAEQVANYLGLQLEEVVADKFSDGESNIEVKENVRGTDSFIIQPTCPPDVNSAIMELLLLIHTLKLSSAKRITAVIPYFGYSRQDQSNSPRTPISASAVAQMIESMRPDRVIGVELHSGQIQGFFHKTPVDELHAEGIFVDYLKRKNNFNCSDLLIVSPDANGVGRAKRVADKLGAFGVITIIKRISSQQTKSLQLAGDVEGKRCIIFDDMIDTAATLTTAVSLLKEAGARQVSSCAIHGVFSGQALKKINESILDEVVVTDSIPQENSLKASNKIKVLSIVAILGEAIKRLHHEMSISAISEEDFPPLSPGKANF